VVDISNNKVYVAYIINGGKEMAMRKLTALKKLAVALNKVTEGYYGMPIVKSKKDDGWDRDTLCWDGPFEWIMVTGGSSVYAGELGNYSLPVEEPIKKVLDEVHSAGYYFEPINNCQLMVCD